MPIFASPPGAPVRAGASSSLASALALRVIGLAAWLVGGCTAGGVCDGLDPTDVRCLRDALLAISDAQCDCPSAAYDCVPTLNAFNFDSALFRAGRGRVDFDAVACRIRYACAAEAYSFCPVIVRAEHPTDDGEACVGNDCREGSACIFDGACPGTCTRLPQIGEACASDCADGGSCIGGICWRRERPVVAPGESCATDGSAEGTFIDPFCAEGWCANDASGSTCVAYADDGEPCGRCGRPGSSCVDGVCRRGPRVGEGCTGECAEGYCSWGTCIARAREGDLCSDDCFASHLRCIDHRCRPVPDGLCDDVTPCLRGACIAGVCRELAIPPGGPCTSDDACAAGSVCCSGTCVAW